MNAFIEFFRRRSAAAILGIVLVTACSERRDPVSSAVESVRGTLSAEAATSQHLPIGLPIPVGQAITMLPEPYTLEKYGPGLPNSMPHANLVGTKDMPELPPRRGRKSRLPTPGTLDMSLAMLPGSPSTKWYAITQTNFAGTSLNVPANIDSLSTILYSPTLLPPGGACIETTTMHIWTGPLHPQTRHYQGWYDWCSRAGGDWAVVEEMTSTWQGNYVRSLGSDPVLSVTLATPANGNAHGGCWYGNIYNYTVGGWEQKFSSCGGGTTYSPSADSGNDGWTAFESWHMGDSGNPCPTVDRTFALGITLYQYSDNTAHGLNDYSGTAYLGAGGYDPNGCWTNEYGVIGAYTMVFPTTIHSMTDSWLAQTP